MKGILISAEPSTRPRVIDVSNGLTDLQGLVGGYIDVVRVGDELSVYINDEGKLTAHRSAAERARDDVAQRDRRNFPQRLHRGGCRSAVVRSGNRRGSRNSAGQARRIPRNPERLTE